jgi:transposase
VTFGLTPGARPEPTAVERLMERGAVKRRRGRPRVRPARVAGDKAYRSAKLRRYLRRRGIGAVIPRRRDERPARRFDRAAYRERTRVERLINRLKPYRRIATRSEKRAANDAAMLTLGCILLWL